MRSQTFYIMLCVSVSIGLASQLSVVRAETDVPLVFSPKQKILESSSLQVSPPALQFDRNGDLHVGWFEKSGEHRSLKTVRLAGREAAAAGLIVQVNPSTHEPSALHQAPGMSIGSPSELYFTWSTSQGKSDAPFASDLVLAKSQDGGETFESPVVVNDDQLPINHSFEHLLARPNGQVYIAWLDHRGKDRSGAGTLFAASEDHGKTIGGNRTIDGMACPCCRPTAALDPDGSLWVAWRKTFDGNVRDVVLAKSADQGRTFSPPRLVHRDGWVFPACPHRGPSLAFDRYGRLYVSWYTEGTDEQPRLLFSTSDDRGRTFSPPVPLHTSMTSLPDQLRMVVHPDGAVVAVWEEVTGVRKRTVMRVSMNRGATFGPVQTLSDGVKAETPTVAVHPGGAVAVAWTEHAWPYNRLIVQVGTLDLSRITKPAP
jgi:hypothetical protein